MIIGSVILILLTILIANILILAISAPIYLHLPRFGKFPSGARLERIRRSPNYRDGKFHNLSGAEAMGNMHFGKLLKTINKILFGKKKISLKPGEPLQMVSSRHRPHLSSTSPSPAPTDTSPKICPNISTI